jgi:glycolate oxidase
MIFDKTQVKARSEQLALSLTRRLGAAQVVTDRDILESYAKDESSCEPCCPDVAIRARSLEDIVATLEEALQLGVPVTARAGGTGKAGGAIPIYGGCVLDVSRMKQVLEIDKTDLVAVVEPGVVTGELHAQVEAMGLFYSPDPNSLETCCIGGNVAHNAGGPRAFKYGCTRENVLGLEAVLMGGAVHQVGKRTIKGVAGYDLTALLVGSEGTLALTSKAVLRLRRKPEALTTLLARFSDEASATQTVARTIEAGLVPRVLEFMDATVVETLRQAGAGSVPEDTSALLLCEFDGPTESAVEADALRFADICEEQAALDVLAARHVGERNALWAARRDMSNAIKKRAAFKVAEDIVVPRSKAPAMLEGMRRIGERHKTLVAAYGHAGDGNYHVNVLWDDPQYDPHPAVDDLIRLVLSLGGTITGEHGIGVAKRRYLPWEKSEAHLALQRGLKSQFDPAGLLNPGKIF